MSTLKRHMSVHEAPKFVCKFCGKAVKSQDTLTEHERSHTGEHPYACPFCDYAAKSSTVLRKHKLAKHSHMVQGIKRMKTIEEQYPHLKVNELAPNINSSN